MSADTLRNWLLAVSLVLSVGSFLFGAFTVQADHERRRRQFTIEIIMRWDTMTRNARWRLENVQHPYFGGPVVLPLVDLNEKRAEAKAKGSDIALDERATGDPGDDARTLLNYMNWVAIAVALDVVDEHTVKVDLGPALRRWHEFLREYRETYFGKLVKDGDPWKDLQSMLDRWFPDVQAQEKRPIWSWGQRRKF